jgi:CheY-like chemotaxis protein
VSKENVNFVRLHNEMRMKQRWVDCIKMSGVDGLKRLNQIRRKGKADPIVVFCAEFEKLKKQEIVIDAL